MNLILSNICIKHLMLLIFTVYKPKSTNEITFIIVAYFRSHSHLHHKRRVLLAVFGQNELAFISTVQVSRALDRTELMRAAGCT